MTEKTAEISLDDLERVTIATDGGVGGRGQTAVGYLLPEDAAVIVAELLKRRKL